MNPMEACVQVNHVSKRFGRNTVLQDIDLTVNRSEVFGLLGPSGAGKTTLVKMIAGIDTATSGTVRVFNERMPKLQLMQKIGYMAQADALYSELTALENLDFFAAIFGLKGSIRKQRIHDVMELVNLSGDLKKFVSHYSGGMKRRLSLAIALLHKPEILILDEPTVGIDPLLRQSIWQEFESLSRGGTTLLVTTHVMDEAEKCHRLGMIRDGRLIAVGTPAQLKQHTQAETLEAAFLQYGGVSV